MKLFVDTSVWTAKALLSRGDQLAVTDHILVESWLLINSRFGRQFAETFWRGVRASAVETLIVTSDDIEAAWMMAAQFPDQDFSLVDRTSFAVMERLELMRAASFDHHFAVYRFGRSRDRAFEIVR